MPNKNKKYFGHIYFGKYEINFFKYPRKRFNMIRPIKFRIFKQINKNQSKA
jgi:hypothetical protein